MLKLTQSCNKLLNISKTPCASSSYKNFIKIKAFSPQRFYSRQSEVLSLDDSQLQELTQGDDTQIHKLKVLLLETEVMRQEGKNIPSQSFLKPQHWKELLSKESRTGRKRYLDYLFKLEKKKENQIAKKERRRVELDERPPVGDTEHIRYDLGHNNMFLRFYDSTINNFHNNKLIQAMRFGEKLVIDCGYEQDMTKREIVNCGKQLGLAFAENRAHDQPFDLHFCNLSTNGILHDYMHRLIPTLHDDWFPINVHEASYREVFPREKIVYLTPHCREELGSYDPDAVYIVGAIVDKVNQEPLSMAKAKREGLKMAKLPLDKHLLWGSGSGKSLTVNQMTSIMLDLHASNDWQYALRHVPRRKLVNEDTMPAPSVKSSRNVQSGRTWRPNKDVVEAINNNDRQRRVLLKNIMND